MWTLCKHLEPVQELQLGLTQRDTLEPQVWQQGTAGKPKLENWLQFSSLPHKFCLVWLVQRPRSGGLQSWYHLVGPELA